MPVAKKESVKKEAVKKESVAAHKHEDLVKEIAALKKELEAIKSEAASLKGQCHSCCGDLSDLKLKLSELSLGSDQSSSEDFAKLIKIIIESKNFHVLRGATKEAQFKL